MPPERASLSFPTRTGLALIPFLSDPFLRHWFVLTLSIAVMNCTSWLFHMFMSRALGPSEYGGLGALMGALVILTVPATAAQMGLSALVARREAMHPQASFPPKQLARWIAGLAALGVILCSGALLFGPKLASLLQLLSPTPVLVAGSVLLSSLSLPVVRGVLQGGQRFMILGASYAGEGLLKLGVGVLLVSVGLGLSGALVGVSIGSLGALALTVMGARGQSTPRSNGDREGDGMIARSLIPYAVAVACFSVLTQSDVVLVKILFPPDAAGLYTAASTAGKIILFLTAPLAMIMLPEVVRRHARGEEVLPVVLRCAAYAAAGGAALVAAYGVLAGPILRVLFGRAYVGAGPLLWPLGLGMLGHELAMLGVYALLARGQGAVFRWLVLHALLFPVALWTLTRSLDTVAWLVAALGITLCVGVWWSLLRRSDPVLAPTSGERIALRPMGRVKATQVDRT